MSGMLVGIVVMLAGMALFAGAARVDALVSAVHQRIGIVPVPRLRAMRGFNIVALRGAALLWVLLSVWLVAMASARGAA